jgi:hypothetical protein
MDFGAARRIVDPLATASFATFHALFNSVDRLDG